MSFIVADKYFLEHNTNGFSHSITDYPDGIIIPIDKPFRWTSADVIRKIKFAATRHFGKKKLKVGHAGTLDPLATGVLLVCIGPATKQAEALQKHNKEYIAGISFGATTASYDLEKEIDRTYSVEEVNETNLRKALDNFIGEQEQIAPLFSAKSVDGIRAYELARKLYKEATAEGKDFNHSEAEVLSKQKINIFETELLHFTEGKYYNIEDIVSSKIVDEENNRNNRINVCDYSHLNLPKADIRIACTKGTYIRAFARDLGEALNSGAHLHSLCRSKTGQFNVEQSLDVNQALSLFDI